MKKIENKVAAILISCLCLYATLIFYPLSTSNKSIPQVYSGIIMTIPYRILVDHQADSLKVSNIIDKTFYETDCIYNKWNLNSEVSKLNTLPANKQVKLSEELFHLLNITKLVVDLSKGRFDPTIEPLQQLWIKNLKKGIEPSSEEISQIMPAIGWNNIHFENGIFFKDHDKTALDLSGIAKGHCIDLLHNRLKEVGCKYFYIEWGGEIRTFGYHPDNRPWKIYISHLENIDPSQAVAHLNLTNSAIATSGDYLQFWKTKTDLKEKTYFHIFNAVNGKPLEQLETSIAGTSVVASTCALADGLATAGMLFSDIHEAKQWAEELKKNFPDLHYWFLSRQSLEKK